MLVLTLKIINTKLRIAQTSNTTYTFAGVKCEIEIKFNFNFAQVKTVFQNFSKLILAQTNTVKCNTPSLSEHQRMAADSS